MTLLNETESLLSYLNKEDAFFYCLVFDPAQRTLLADRGEYPTKTDRHFDLNTKYKDIGFFLFFRILSAPIRVANN